MFVSMANEKMVAFHRNTGREIFFDENKLGNMNVFYSKMEHGI